MNTKQANKQTELTYEQKTGKQTNDLKQLNTQTNINESSQVSDGLGIDDVHALVA